MAELSACADEQRYLLEAIGDLPEEQRAVLLLRFYENLPPREIAKHLDVPVNTVRTRQRLGVERLRIQLDQRHGADSTVWATALLPLAGMGGRGSAVAGAAAAAVAVEKVAGLSFAFRSRLLGAGVLLLAVGGAGWWFFRGGEVSDLSQTTTPEVALAAIFDTRSPKAATGRSEPASLRRGTDRNQATPGIESPSTPSRAVSRAFDSRLS